MLQDEQVGRALLIPLMRSLGNIAAGGGAAAMEQLLSPAATPALQALVTCAGVRAPAQQAAGRLAACFSGLRGLPMLHLPFQDTLATDARVPPRPAASPAEPPPRAAEGGVLGVEQHRRHAGAWRHRGAEGRGGCAGERRGQEGRQQTCCDCYGTTGTRETTPALPFLFFPSSSWCYSPQALMCLLKDAPFHVRKEAAFALANICADGGGGTGALSC